MAEYTNDLRIKEIGIGEEAGAWGTTLNTQLSLLAEGFSYGVENLGSDANATITMANGASDEARSLYLKITSTSLSATRTVTLAPESVSKVWIIENATTGSQSITITQGGGQHGVTIPNGQVKIVYSTGDSESPSGVYDALDNLELGGAATAATSVTAPLIEGSTSIQTPLIEYTDGDDAITIADGGGITAANGITSTAAANTFGATSFNDADITNVGSISLDTIVSDTSPAAITVGYGGSDTLTVNGLTTMTTDGNGTTLTLVSTDADANGGPILDFYRNSSSPADNDVLFQSNIYAENDADEKVAYAYINTFATDVSNGSESMKLNLNMYSAGTALNRLELSSSETVFNQDSGDVDFRVESNGSANMLFVDGGNDVVNIGAATVETGDQFSIHGSGTNTTMRIYNTNAGTDGGLLIFQKNSSSPADADVLGDIRFHGNDDGGGMTQFARIKIESTDVSNGTEDGKMRFEILKAGTTREFLQLGPSNIVFNDDQQDIDFRVESNSDGYAFFINGGDSVVNFGGSDTTRTISGVVPKFQGNSLTRMDSSIGLVNNSNDTLSSMIMFGKTRSASHGGHTVAAAGDAIGAIVWNPSDGTDMGHTSAAIDAVVNAGIGSNDVPASLRFYTNYGTTSSQERMRITEEGTVAVGSGVSTAGVGAGAIGTSWDLYRKSDQAAVYGIMSYQTSTATTVWLYGADADRSASTAYYHFVGRSNVASAADNEFLLRGDGNAFCDGSWSGGGADYAEYFEWKDGNSNSEDRRGYSVVLDGNMIRKATSDDVASSIIGIVSAAPAIVGDSDTEQYKQKYLRDDFGSFIWEEHTITEWTETSYVEHLDAFNEHIVSYETDKIPSDVTPPSEDVKDSEGRIIKTKAVVKDTEEDGTTKLKRRKLNPDYDSSKTYETRESRKEWETIGLMGKLRMRKGQPTGDRWIKMKDITDSIEEWLVR